MTEITLQPGQSVTITAAAPPPPPDPTPDPPPAGTVGGYPERRGPQAFEQKPATATVSGSALADLEKARDKAGVNGVVNVPAGQYPWPKMTVAGQRWQLDPNAVMTGQLLPLARGVAILGGEMRGGAWLGVASGAHDTVFDSIRVRGAGITNESRSGMKALRLDFREIAGDFIKLFYDSTAHADVQGLTIEDCVGFRTTYAVDGVAAFSGADGGGKRKLFAPVIRNNWLDNGIDSGLPGNGAFAGFELWGVVGGLYEYNDLKGGGFLHSCVRDKSSKVRWNRGYVQVGKAWAFWESGGTGTEGTEIYENEILGEPARNGVVVTMSTPDPSTTNPVRVHHNLYRSIRLTDSPGRAGYVFNDNVQAA